MSAKGVARKLRRNVAEMPSPATGRRGRRRAAHSIHCSPCARSRGREVNDRQPRRAVAAAAHHDGNRRVGERLFQRSARGRTGSVGAIGGGRRVRDAKERQRNGHHERHCRYGSGDRDVALGTRPDGRKTDHHRVGCNSSGSHRTRSLAEVEGQCGERRFVSAICLRDVCCASSTGAARASCPESWLGRRCSWRQTAERLPAAVAAAPGASTLSASPQ